MTVTSSAHGDILLGGECGIEDAESLLRALAEKPDAIIDWSRCTQAHTAVIQVLMVSGRPLVGKPTNPFLRDHLGPQIGNP
jgi:hypothetical protein